jgi:beta-glucanase (GH16 family)
VNKSNRRPNRFLPSVVIETLEARRLMSAPGANWKPAWSDEFNGHGLNGNNWSVGLAWTGADGTNRYFGSQNLSYITDNNIVVNGGMLHLLTQKQDVTNPSGTVFHYTEGYISTANKVSMTYGYVEIRAQVPVEAGPGLWPAFWMLGSGWPPEEDVAEFFTSSNRFHQGLAYGTASNVHWDDVNTNTPLPTGFHTYGMEWGPGYQVFTVDDQITHVSRGSYVPRGPMSFILNSGVAADSPPTDATVFPNSFDVDYVRVFKRDATPYIENPGFEGGSLGLWQGQYNADVVNTDASSRNFALRLQGDGSSAQQVISGLKPNMTYVLTGMAKTQDGTNQAAIGVKDYGGADTSAASNSGTYSPLAITFRTGRSNTAATIYGLQSGGVGSAWFDDFAIHQAGVIQNANLASGLAAWNASGSVAVARQGPGSQNVIREDGSPSSVEQTVYGLMPDTAYRLSAWVKVSAPGGHATIGITDSSGAQAETTATNRRYRRVSVAFTTGSGSTTATIFCENSVDSNSAFFGGFQLTALRAGK